MEVVQRRAQLTRMAAQHFANHLGTFAWHAWRQFIEWKRELLARVLPRASLSGACFRKWTMLLRGVAMRDEDAKLLRALDRIGLSWLMPALGEVLPSLLPDESLLAKTLDHEFRRLLASRRPDARVLQLQAEATRARVRPPPSPVESKEQTTLKQLRMSR